MLHIPEEIKKLFRQGSIRKNIRIHFPNGELEDITNNNLLSESFSFTESIMSQDTFKFGLCEASMVEFEMFNIGNIKGYEIEVFHEIDISSLSDDFIAEYGMTSDDVAFPFYRIPYGRFVIDECLKSADMKKRNVVAYGYMLQMVQPNEIEVLKSNIAFSAKGNYKIDFLKYLYSNTTVDSVIPSATFSKVGTYVENMTYPIILPDTTMRIVTNSYIYSVPEKNDDLYKVVLGNQITSIQQAVEDMCEYIKTQFPNSYDKFVFEMDGWAKNLLSERIQMNGSNSGSAYLKNDAYVYPYIPSGNSSINIPISFTLVSSQNEILAEYQLRNLDEVKIQKINTGFPEYSVSYPLKKGKDGLYYIKDIPYNELPERIEDAIELYGKFGKVDRYGNFQMIAVNQNFGLVPSSSLVPSSTLVPSSLNGEFVKKDNYSSLWYDDYKTLPYDRVSVSYKNADGEEEYAEKWLVDNESENYNANNYQEYSLSENYLIKNGIFTQEQIEQILDMVASSLIGLQYMPFEMESVGIPYLESGDALLVETNDNNFQTLVLNRRIDGIQSLKDNFNAD